MRESDFSIKKSIPFNAVLKLFPDLRTTIVFGTTVSSEEGTRLQKAGDCFPRGNVEIMSIWTNNASANIHHIIDYFSFLARTFTVQSEYATCRLTFYATFWSRRLWDLSSCTLTTWRHGHFGPWKISAADWPIIGVRTSFQSK
jgi:hypothetical protein